MDRLDRKILRLLQEDSTLAVAEIAKKVGLSTTPCWRRIQKLEEEGVIRRRVAILDPVKINARVTVFVSIRTNSHSHEWLKRFSEVIAEFPEVIEFYRMSGDVDYLLRDPRCVLLLRHGADQVYHRTAARLSGSRQGERGAGGLIGRSDASGSGHLRFDTGQPVGGFRARKVPNCLFANPAGRFVGR
jgi:predicted transcriptional regulator